MALDFIPNMSIPENFEIDVRDAPGEVVVDPMRRRDHNRPKGLHEAKKELNRVAKGTGARLDRRIATFPQGEYVLLMRCHVVDGRTGVVSEHMRIVGTGMLRAAVDDHLETLLTYTGEPAELVVEAPVAGAADADRVEARSYLEMPENAVERSKKLRVMLQRAWVLEGHSPVTKHIYNAVKKGSPGFAWWHDEFPDVEFTNMAVEAADVSRKIFPIVATKLHELLTGRLPGEETPAPEEPPAPPVPREPEGPFAPCLRSILCTRCNRHRGRCNKRGRRANAAGAHDTNEMTTDSIEDIIDDIIEDPSEEDPGEEPIEDPGEEPVEDPVEDLDEDPAEDIIEDPVEDIIEDPVEDRTEPLDDPHGPRDVFMDFMARVQTLAHEHEPFVHLTRGQIAMLKAYMDAGKSRVAAYRAMGLGVTPEYEEWARKSQGVRAWRQLAVEFPGCMETLVAHGHVSDRYTPRAQPKKPKTAKTRKTQKNAFAKNSASRKMRTRKRNEKSSEEKVRALRRAGYQVY